MMTKPFLLITLAHYTWYALAPQGRLAYAMTIALLFSWLGDIFLLFDNTQVFFILGLLSFACTHILYTAIFLSWGRGKGQQSLGGIVLSTALSLSILMFSILYGNFLWEKTGDFRIPVLGYIILITMMAIAASWRFQKAHQRSFAWALLGSLLFVLSDSSLAYGKFVSPYPLQGFVIMLTYILGQWCIVKGIVAHES
ncbi:lysoplasmalogenase [Pseudobacteriovorax antillogorgiicola]|nr:lysoplasmalogenase [Pseudobacteriovorax antillogorgiicola]